MDYIVKATFRCPTHEKLSEDCIACRTLSRWEKAKDDWERKRGTMLKELIELLTEKKIVITGIR